MMISQHQQQHLPRIDCLPANLPSVLKLLVNCQMKTEHAAFLSTNDCHQPAVHKSPNVKSTLHIPKAVSELTNESSRRTWHTSLPLERGQINLHHVLFQIHSINEPKCIFELKSSWPPNARICSHDHSLEVHDHGLHCASRNSLNYGLHTPLYIHMITASLFTQSGPP